MYYSAGTYESFAHPEKPRDVDKKSAYIIGTGLAGLTAAFYLVRDGQMKGEHIHVFEKLDLAGGSCDGRKDITKGFFMRGGREMDNHFEVMWDTFRDVPSIETPGVSVLDEYYWLNKHDPNYSLCRASVNRGEDAHTDKQFKLDKDSALALSQLFLTPEKDLEDKKISDVLPESFWSTNFWLYWQTMFAFQRWSSALEMKRYLCRYVHHIDGLPDFSALRFTKYNQYESMILPLVKYLESHGVHIEYGMDVRNVIIETEGDKKIARQIVYVKDGKEQTIDLIEDDLVFITNGCCTDTSCYGDQTHAPDLSSVKNGAGESWDMWKAIAAQAEHGEYGNPDTFCSDVDATNWMSATVATSNEEIIRHIVAASGEDPIVSTTGKASRELFEIREANGQGHRYDFLTVGSMGHSSSIALGVAVHKPDAKIWCVDGDGAVLMHMGAMAVLGSEHPGNMIHIVINNGAHETVGGMPTVAAGVDLPAVAKACGYPFAVSVDSFESLDSELKAAKARHALTLIEVKCAIGAREDLGRPTTTARENKENFMAFLKNE